MDPASTTFQIIIGGFFVLAIIALICETFVRIAAIKHGMSALKDEQKDRK